MAKIKDPPVIDELTTGLSAMFVDKKVPLWVAYASQIFVDIHNSLREDVGRCRLELQTCGAQIDATLNEYYNTGTSITVQRFAGVHRRSPQKHRPTY